MLSLPSFNIISGNPHVDALIIGSGLPKHRSGSWRRHNLKGVCWCVDGDLT